MKIKQTKLELLRTFYNNYQNGRNQVSVRPQITDRRGGHLRAGGHKPH